MSGKEYETTAAKPGGGEGGYGGQSDEGGGEGESGGGGQSGGGEGEGGYSSKPSVATHSTKTTYEKTTKKPTTDYAAPQPTFPTR